MAEATTRVCGVTLESFFVRPVTFRGAQLDEVAQKCLEAFSSYALRPAQISVRSGDQTFNYDLSFSLFNGNGTFKLGAEKLDIGLQNAVNSADLEIVQDFIAKIYEHVPLPEINSTAISANAHATFESAVDMREFFARYANPGKQIVAGGAIAYMVAKGWPEEMRLMLDKSLVFPDGVFMMWTTVHRGGKLSRADLKTVNEAFQESLTRFDLTFRTQAT